MPRSFSLFLFYLCFAQLLKSVNLYLSILLQKFQPLFLQILCLSLWDIAYRYVRVFNIVPHVPKTLFTYFSISPHCWICTEKIKTKQKPKHFISLGLYNWYQRIKCCFWWDNILALKMVMLITVCFHIQITSICLLICTYMYILLIYNRGW